MKWFWPLFGAGVLVDWIGIFGPVHELFHWALTWASGGQAAITRWCFTSVDRVRLIPLMAGPWGELFIWTVVAFLLLANGRFLAAGFFLGVFAGCWLGQPVGTDFHYLSDFLDNPWTVYVAWTLYGAFVLTLAGASVVVVMKGPASQVIHSIK